MLSFREKKRAEKIACSFWVCDSMLSSTSSVSSLISFLVFAISVFEACFIFAERTCSSFDATDKLLVNQNEIPISSYPPIFFFDLLVTPRSNLHVNLYKYKLDSKSNKYLFLSFFWLFLIVPFREKVKFIQTHKSQQINPFYF